MGTGGLPINIPGVFIGQVTFFAYDPEFADVPGAVASFTKSVDASVTEGHGFKVLGPRHPVFNGIPVTDNARPEPDELHVVAFFSDVGSNLVDTAQKLIAAPLGGYSVDAYHGFKDAAKKGFLWTINTSLEIYTNMMLAEGDVERNVKKGNSVELSMRFREVRKASFSLTTGSIVQKPSVKANAAKTVQGAKPPISEADPSLNSVGVNILNGFKSATGGK